MEKQNPEAGWGIFKSLTYEPVLISDRSSN